MGEASRGDTRAAILDATWALIVERNSCDFGLEQVGRRAGVSRQTVYAHFANRADLLVAVVESYKQRVGYEEMVEPLLAAPTAIDALEELVRFYLDFMAPVRNLHVAIDAERARDPDLERSFRARDSGRHQYAAHVATRLAAEGHLAETWTVATTADLISACTSATFALELLDRHGWSLEELRLRLLQMFTNTFVSVGDTTTHTTTGVKA